MNDWTHFNRKLEHFPSHFPPLPSFASLNQRIALLNYLSITHMITTSQMVLSNSKSVQFLIPGKTFPYLF